ncbi:sulfur carrier protein ThiS [Acidithiobacillus acidisediminis]|uniref:sulfur carrier protein ThiS n=1 Tax=Acidithiobacillus acidisediminis TaxID=2937799 RepID=UPI00200CD6AF|nr:sulfur carrier protein ThiS [Acidithiobacillus sp. S30A2]
MTQKITIQVNGLQQMLPAGSNVLALLDMLALTGKRVAVERNGGVVPRSEQESTVLLEGDQIEVIRAVGGG